MNQELLNLSRSFFGKVIFQSKEIQLPEFGLFLIKGNNGEGKTTLLRCFATLTKLSKGDAVLQGKSLQRNPGEIRKVLGYCSSQENQFLPRLTGWENLLHYALLAGLKRSEIQEKLDDFKMRGLITDLALQSPYLFSSSGMKQSLALVRAFIANPFLLLLDEPLSSLDQGIRSAVFNYLVEIKNNRLIFFVAHDVVEVSDFDGILRIEKGELYFQ